MRVLIVASDAAAAEAVRRALRYAPSCRVIGWVDVRRACAGPVAEARPDVVIFDGGSGQATILGQVPGVRAALPDAKLVLLAQTLDSGMLADAAAAGIDAAIDKTASPAGVGMLVREIAAGHVFHFAPAGGARSDKQQAASVLTCRELEILRHAAAGLSNSRIAAELWVTEQTVKFHLSNVYRKLGLSNRTEAAHYAHVHGLTEQRFRRERASVAA
jgi:DNA-binding NarL/FixJ family response regulator